ncbi:hypothetical protein O181_001895 [Austropuccinia psidii MF-1]|uniref:Uncharacterized protein n=1 Tax=Austropuccinia psidii MF-1 TaxID=1389203 RepID=A0A9Q3BC01_9BASI|nr:hypothetical protein [Austropuccinia psidii MF-1]
MEENFIPLETQSQDKTPVATLDIEGKKGKGKRHSESLITSKKWIPSATKRTRKPQISASIQGKTALINYTGMINKIKPVVTFKGKFPKAVDNKFVQGTVKGILESQRTSQRTDKDCLELADQCLDTGVDSRKLRKSQPHFHSPSN